MSAQSQAGAMGGAPMAALQLIGSGRWPVDLMCSHDFPLDRVHDAILATAGRGIDGAIHVTVSPWRPA